jgi:hypothetical protein
MPIVKNRPGGSTVTRPRKTIAFSVGEVSKIQNTLSDDGKQVLAAMLAEKGIGTAAAHRVRTFSEAVRLLIQLSLWELHRTEMSVQYQQTAEAVNRLMSDGSAQSLEQASVSAVENTHSRMLSSSGS